MPRRILIEEFHLTVTVPPATPDAARERVRRALAGRPVLAALRRAVRAVFARHRLSPPARVTLTH